MMFVLLAGFGFRVWILDNTYKTLVEKQKMVRRIVGFFSLRHSRPLWLWYAESFFAALLAGTITAQSANDGRR